MLDLQVDLSKKGIWKYFKYFPTIEEKYWLSLNEGGTPIIEADGIIFKREDLNPTGSLKDRGLAYQISQALASGEKNLAISSSGNSGISTAAYCQQRGINLSVFLPKNIAQGKLEKIKQFEAEVLLSSRPLSDSIKFSKEKGFKNLRPSVDPLGPEGFKTIAFELAKQVGRFDDLFLPVSSATCLMGIAAGFEILDFFPRIHACQSTKVFLIASQFDKEFKKSKTSLAQSLVAKVVPRKNQALEIIRKTGGWGWVISDSEIKKAVDWLAMEGIETSAEGALALASIWKAKSKNFEIGKAVCVLTGKKY